MDENNINSFLQFNSFEYFVLHFVRWFNRPFLSLQAKLNQKSLWIEQISLLSWFHPAYIVKASQAHLNLAQKRLQAYSF